MYGDSPDVILDPNTKTDYNKLKNLFLAYLIIYSSF